MPRVETHFIQDHPTAAGHFPGNPIIPGALLLDTVLHTIAGDSATAGTCVIRAAKFLRPVRPGDRIRIEWEDLRGEMHFRCILVEGEEIAVTGMLRLVDAPV
jgi:3-hydroxyacyl-[acyl-carrier-protein] dehydratase